MDLWVPNARVGNDESVVFQAGVNFFAANVSSVAG
jgi:hypothetical protein